MGSKAADHDTRVRDHLQVMGVSPEATEAYLALEQGEIAPGDAEMEELRRHRLVSPSSISPIPISTATAAWTSEQRARLAALESSAESFARSYSNRRSGSFIEVLSGTGQVGEVFLQVQESAQSEVRSLDRPPYISGDNVNLSPAMQEGAARGIKFRTVYLTSLLHLPPIREVIRLSTDMGEDARMHPDIAFRLTLRDDDLGLVLLPRPSPTTPQLDALLIHPSLLLDSLQRLFESTWARSLPINFDKPGVGEDVDRRILILMSSGLTDARIAATLGVSERTIARRVSRMQERLGAPSRFLLGVRAAQDNLL